MSAPKPFVERFVSVVVEKRRRQHKQWLYTDWQVTGVLPAPTDTGEYRTLIQSETDCDRYLCGPLPLRLYKDGSESYWNNLMGENPSLFVVCRQDEDDADLDPFIATFNYDEIIGFMEVDDKVFSFPIPEELYGWVEEFIVTHYEPHTPKKRKRKNWAQDGEHGAPPSQRRH